MPVYEYYCPNCRREFELRRPFSQSAAPASCPSCQSEGRKLLSSFATRNGSNWEIPEKPLRTQNARR